MKNKSFIRLLLIILIITFGISGCLDYTITTQVNADGSLDRTYTVRGDSADIFDGSLKIPADSSWNISTKWESVVKNDSSVERKYVYTARKHFANVRALNKEIYTDSSYIDKVNIRAAFEKRFRWFYTFITYRETYLMYFPFREIPVNNYLSDLELGVLMDSDEKNYVFDPVKNDFVRVDEKNMIPKLTKQDSAEMKKRENEISDKFDKWQAASIIEDYFRILLTTVNNDTTSITSSDSLKWAKDSLTNVFFHSNLNVQTSEELTDILSRITHNSHITQLYDQHKSNFNGFDYKLKYTDFFSDDYTNEVIMPGLLINTNAKTVEGNKVTWEFDALRFYATNFEMIAESRIVNRWAIVVSGIVAAVLFVLLILGIFVKKK